MAEPIPPIHIVNLEHDRVALANYNINRDRILFANVNRTPQNIIQFSNLLNRDFLEENVMALNGPAFAHLLNSEGMPDLKSKIFNSAQPNYDVNELIPEQVLFLTMFHHIHCLAYAYGGEIPSIQNTFTERFRKLIERIRSEPASQMLFGQTVAPIARYFSYVQANLIEDERHHITFSAFLEMLEGGAPIVQTYIEEGRRRYSANNATTNTQYTHFTSNTRRGLDAISNPTFNNEEEEPEPQVDTVVLDEDARSAVSQQRSVYGSIGTGAPSNYSVGKQSFIKTIGTIQLGNLAPEQKAAAAAPALPQRAPVLEDPDLLELQRRLEDLGKPTTAKVPPAAAAAAPILPPAINAALKKGATVSTAEEVAPLALRNSKGRPVRPSLKQASNTRSVTRKHARFPRGNRGTVEEISYSKEAPPSGVITNTENVLRGTVYPTYRSLGRLESRRKTGVKPEAPYVPGQKKKKE
jgi:hypothetical protein